MNKDPNKRHYFDPIGREKIDAIANELVKKGALIKAWIQGNQDDVERLTASEFNGEKEKCLWMTSQKGAISGLLKSRHIGKIMCFQMGEGKDVFFTTAKLQYDDEYGQYFIVLESNVFRAQQRKDYRLAASEYSVLQCKIGDMEPEVLDISASGIGIKVSEGEQENFPPNKEFPECIIKFNNKKYVIYKTEVSSRREHPREPGKLIVGLKFKRLSIDVETDLSRQIHSIAREEEIRKMLMGAKE